MRLQRLSVAALVLCIVGCAWAEAVPSTVAVPPVPEKAQPGTIASDASGLQVAHTDLQWFRDAKFGLFVHWGPLCTVATSSDEISFSRQGPRGGTDTTMLSGTIPMEVYDNLYKQFNPVKYDPKAWVELAKAAHMNYIVFTTKHHDGFCMFDSALTDYKVTNSPIHRDLTKELADACHAANFRLGLYYSPADWHHPDYATANHARYIDYLHGQMRELCSNYGKVDLIWFDGGPPPQGWDSEGMFKLIRQLQPNIIFNDRGGLPGDYSTHENFAGPFNLDRMWETCYTLSWPWIWHPDANILPLKDCIQLLVRCTGRGGNLLLNVGPTPGGEIDAAYAARLREIGAWLDLYGESIFGTQAGPYIMGPNSCMRNGNKLYLHIVDWNSPILLQSIGRKLISSSVLTGGTVKMEETETGWTVNVPPSERNDIDTVIKLELDEPTDGIAPLLAFHSGSLAAGKSVTSSDCPTPEAGKGESGPSRAVDDDYDTRWIPPYHGKQDWLEIDLGAEQTFNRARLMEWNNRITSFSIEVKQDGEWRTIHQGGTIGDCLDLTFEPVTARYVRLNLLDALKDGFRFIEEIQLFAPADK